MSQAANKTSQATAVFTLLLFLRLVPAAPEFFRSLIVPGGNPTL